MATAGTGAKGRARAVSGRHAALVAAAGALWGVVAFADTPLDNAAAMRAALRTGGASVILCFYPVKQDRHVVCESVGEISRIFPHSAPTIGRMVDERAEQWARAQLVDFGGTNPLSSLRAQFLGCAGQAPNRAGVVMGMQDLTWTIGGDPTGRVGTCSSAATPSLLDSGLGAFWQTADSGATYVANLIAEREACMQSRRGGQGAQARRQGGSLMGDPDQGNPGAGGSQGNQDSSDNGTKQTGFGFRGDDGGRPGSIWTPTTPSTQNSNDTPTYLESGAASRSRAVRTIFGHMLRNAYHRLGMQSSHDDSGAGSAAIGGRGYCLEGMGCAGVSTCAAQAHGRAMAKALAERFVATCNADVMPTPEGSSACVSALGGQLLDEAQLTQLKRQTCELMHGMMGGGSDLVYTGCALRTAPDIAAARRVGCADPAAMCTAEQNLGAPLPALPGGRLGHPGGRGVAPGPSPDPDPDPDPPQNPDPFHPPK